MLNFLLHLETIFHCLNLTHTHVHAIQSQFMGQLNDNITGKNVFNKVCSVLVTGWFIPNVSKLLHIVEQITSISFDHPFK